MSSRHRSLGITVGQRKKRHSRVPGRSIASKARTTICENGMKCVDPKCDLKHPDCKRGSKCKNQTCGFMHPDGHRYTTCEATTLQTTCKNAQQSHSSMCWKKHKCQDNNCTSSHPACRNGILCNNPKCGFEHTDGRRYTISYQCFPTKVEAGTIVHRQIKYQEDNLQSSIRRVDCSTAKNETLKKFPLVDNDLSDLLCRGDLNQTNTLQSRNPKSISSDKSQERLLNYGKVVRAHGCIICIDENRENAWLKPKLHFFARHDEFYKAAKKCVNGARLDMVNVSDDKQIKILTYLSIGDHLSAQMYLDHDENIVAFNVKFLNFNPEGRSCAEIISLVEAAFQKDALHENMIAQILNLESASNVVVGAVLKKTHLIWTDCSQLLRARRLKALFLQSSFLYPEGSMYCQLDKLCKEELFAARDMLGCMCMLDEGNINCLFQISAELAPYLGSYGLSFLSGLLKVAAPLRNSDNLSYVQWWKLPSVPLGQETIQMKTCGITDINSLPSVIVGAPYPNIEVYVSTYMRLHRADCFFSFVDQLQRFELSEFSNTDLVVCDNIIVCGMNVSTASGEMDIQLGCTVKYPSNIRHSSFALTHMVCISIRGDFKDDQLIWGIVSQPPKQNNSFQRRDNNCIVNSSKNENDNEYQMKGYRIVFSIRWCSKINSVSDDSILNILQNQQNTASLVENPVSFVSFEPVLDALRSLWRPGKLITLPFQESLLTGKCVFSEDNDLFHSVGETLEIPQRLDEFQLKAYSHVARHQLSLVQGPPGCGKSYLGSRICRILADISDRVLIVTYKNHALDEMLLDIANLYGESGIEKIIRIGNNKKISRELKARSLQSVMSSSEENSANSKKLHQLARKCNLQCKELQEEFNLNHFIFSQATGSAGVNVVNSTLGRTIDFAKSSFADDTLADTEVVNKFLAEWAKPALEKIKKESKAYWKKFSSDGNDIAKEQQCWSIEQNQGKDMVEDFEGFSEIRPDSVMGVMIAFGMSNNTFSSVAAEMDISMMMYWGHESKTTFLLFVLQVQFEYVTNSFTKIAQHLALLQSQAKASRLNDEICALQTVPIVGSTMLGALLNMDAISAAEPTVLLMEEAGEIPEAALIALLRIPSLKRCIMIGDHQQLRPAINSHELRVHKKLDISCFERLVKLGIKIAVLKTQNRMRDDVLLPVTQHYPGIVSNKSITQNLNSIPWLVRPLFWWVCEYQGTKQNASWFNEEQALRATRLASFLIDQGSTFPNKITILVPYTSQLFYVKMLLRKSGNDEVVVSTIDQYQGDENDIVILTLVRCNPKNPQKLGFLGQVNRMIVAVSRQKLSLIIVGSENCFANSPHWKTLQDALKDPVDAPRISKCLPLRCPRHMHKVLLVPDSKHFPTDGCGEGCGLCIGECSHMCSLKCHPLSKAHGKCKKLVEYSYIPCHHVFNYQCHAILKLCPKDIQIKHKKCGHTQIVTCGKYNTVNKSEMKCDVTCEVNLPCNHQIWLRCGSKIDGYVSAEFNACPTCIFKPIDTVLDPYLLMKKIKTKEVLDHSNPNRIINAKESKLISDAVAREGLCDIRFVPSLEIALRVSRLPSALVALALPSPDMWNPRATSDDRRYKIEAFAKQQRLWRILLQESGIVIPLSWQKHPLTLLAGIALTCKENTMTKQSAKHTNAEIFSHRLQILHNSSITCPHEFIHILKSSGNSLYKTLSDSPKSKSLWYDIEEGRLAEIATSRLKLATSVALRSAIDKSNFNAQEVFEKICNKRMHSTVYRTLRLSWGMSGIISGDLYAPPYEEVPHDFLYSTSNACRNYISLDLKSADFHVLRIAAPELIQQSTWGEWIQSTIPGYVKQVPFLAEMKPLRVRVLGKMLHKKNAALQCHCIRILLRFLLVVAYNNPSEFAIVDRVFQFSCDELCVKLKAGTKFSTAADLLQKISGFLEKMNWSTLLPVRLELFKLCKISFDINALSIRHEDTEATGACSASIAHIHVGHPALRESTQFVDLPAIHDPVWEKKCLSPLSALEYSDNRSHYYVRHKYCNTMQNEEDYELEFKTVPKRLRPSIMLNQIAKKMRNATRTKHNKNLSYNTPEFIPVKYQSLDTQKISEHQLVLPKTTKTLEDNVSNLSSGASEYIPQKTSQHQALSPKTAKTIKNNASILSSAASEYSPTNYC